MDNKLRHLESLARLAKGADSEGRQELLREVTDLFMETPEGLSQTEIDYFGDIMERLAFELEMKLRKHLAETLAGLDAAPHDLMAALANDEIEVARPVLMKSGVLKDADLLNIIRQCGQDHLLAVSMRALIAEPVADALVERGNDEVLGVLAGNAGAELSQNAMETMVSRSEGNETLHEILVTRPEMPADLMEKMFSHVSQALREHIMASGVQIDESQVDGLMAEAQSWLAPEQGEGQGEREASQAEKFIDRKEKLKQLDPKLLLKLMRDGKILEFVAGVARLAKIDLSTARQTIFDQSGEKLAVVCKAMEVDKEMFAELVDLTDTEGRRSDADKADLLGVYGRITDDSAQRAMRFLRTRQILKKHEGGGEAPKQVDWGS